MKSKILLLAALGFGTMSAGAQDIAATMARCASVSDDHARLSCYDGIAAGIKHTAAPGSQPAAPPQQVQAAAPTTIPTVATKTAEFGAETLRYSQPDRDTTNEFNEIKATVTKVEFSKTNRFIVTLDNGQVWRQIDGDLTNARFHKSGDAVTISRGLFGSYNLSLEGHNIGLVKVHRIR